MTQKVINRGSAPGDGKGETLYDAFGKVNDNFTELYSGVFTTLTLSGVGTVFSGDFSNATVASRNAFKTSTTNGSTGIYALPNGTSTAASWQATNAANPTNASKILIATNGSTDVQLVSGVNGTGTYLPLAFYNGNAKQVEIPSVPSAVNYLQLKGSVTTLSPVVSALGTDTNIPLAFVSKGTGAIDLAAGSSGVNISNGGTVTAITITSLGNTTYTGVPTATISVPTTAGGVQATANVFMGTVTAGVTIASGGTGYTAGDVLTVSGGTSTVAAQLTVSTVSAGVITAVTVTGAGNYSVIPTNNVSVTGGTGTGATFTVLWRLNTLTIGTAGSGYVEQPTVSFSGGGGSGAAAYATVGSIPTLKTLGSSLSINTPGGEQVRVFDKANSINYLRLNGNSSGAGVDIMARGGDAAVNTNVISYGTGSIDFFTNHDSFVRQMRVAHTASAVNYVQVTGAATGGAVKLSAQGSDSNIDYQMDAKGTGNIRFGTYTASVLTPTGYITIKDSGGTTRRLLVG